MDVLNNIKKVINAKKKQEEYEKQQSYWKAQEDYVKKVKCVHYGEVPNKIRKEKYEFDFNDDFSDLSIRPLPIKIKEYMDW